MILFVIQVSDLVPPYYISYLYLYICKGYTFTYKNIVFTLLYHSKSIQKLKPVFFLLKHYISMKLRREVYMALTTFWLRHTYSLLDAFLRRIVLAWLCPFTELQRLYSTAAVPTVFDFFWKFSLRKMNKFKCSCDIIFITCY